MSKAFFRRRVPGQASGTRPLLQSPPNGSCANNGIPADLTSYFQGLEDEPQIECSIGSQAKTTVVGSVRCLGNVGLGAGWSGLEPWGVWTDGDQAEFFVKTPAIARSRTDRERDCLKITLGSMGFVSSNHPELAVELSCRNLRSAFHYRWPNACSLDASFAVPSNAIDTAVIRISLKMINPTSPFEDSEGRIQDHRLLGVGLRRVTIVRETAGSEAGLANPVSN